MFGNVQKQQNASQQQLHQKQNKETKTHSFFSQLRNMVKTAGVVISGAQVTREEVFCRNWDAVSEFYETGNQRYITQIHLNKTTLTKNLQTMINCLEMEWEEQLLASQNREQNRHGAGKGEGEGEEAGCCCSDILVEDRILAKLAIYGETDIPHDMQYVVLRFFKKVVQMAPIDLLMEKETRSIIYGFSRVIYNELNERRSKDAATKRRLMVGNPGGIPAAMQTPRLSRVGKEWRNSNRNNVDQSKKTLLIRHELVEIVHSLMLRLKDVDRDKVNKFFDWNNQALGSTSTKISSSEAKVKQKSSNSGSRKMGKFYLWVLFENLMEPGLTGESAREGLYYYSQVLARSASEGAAEIIYGTNGTGESDNEGIILGLIENISYLYAQLPMGKAASRSMGVRLFTAKNYGRRALSVPIRKLFEYEIRHSDTNENEIGDRYYTNTSRKMGKRSSSKGRMNSYVNNDGNSSGNAGEFEELTSLGYQKKISNSVISHKQTDVDLYYMCWELLDELAVVFTKATNHNHNHKLGNSEAENMIKSIVKTITEKFLSSTLIPGLLNTPNTVAASSTTTYVIEMIKVSHSECLRIPLLKSLLEADQGRGLDVLLSRIKDSQNERLALSTLKLFDTMFDTLDQYVYEYLVLKYFTPHTDSASLRSLSPSSESPSSPSSSFSSSSSPSSPLSILPNPFPLGTNESLVTDYKISKAVASHFCNISPSNISDYMPEAVIAAASATFSSKFQPTNPIDINESETNSDYITQNSTPNPEQFLDSKVNNIADNLGDPYVISTVQKVSIVYEIQLKTWNNHRSQISSTNHKSDLRSNDEHDIDFNDLYPGPFLHTLFQLLRSLLKRHLAHILLITSIFSRLASLPHQNLSSYLFLQSAAVNSNADDHVDTTNPNDNTSPDIKATKPRRKKNHTHSLVDIITIVSSQSCVKAELVENFVTLLHRFKDVGIRGASSTTSIKNLIFHPQSLTNSSITSPSSPPPSSISPHYSLTLLNNIPHSDLDATPNTNLSLIGNQHSISNNNEDDGHATSSAAISRFIFAYLSLDEFCKEMAAIALSHYIVSLDYLLDSIVFTKFNSLLS